MNGVKKQLEEMIGQFNQNRFGQVRHNGFEQGVVCVMFVPGRVWLRFRLPQSTKNNELNIVLSLHTMPACVFISVCACVCKIAVCAWRGCIRVCVAESKHICICGDTWCAKRVHAGHRTHRY